MAGGVGSGAAHLAKAQPLDWDGQTDAIWGRGRAGRGWRERADVPIAAALGLLCIVALSPPGSALPFHSSSVKSTPCPLAWGLGDAG